MSSPLIPDCARNYRTEDTETIWNNCDLQELFKIIGASIFRGTQLNPRIIYYHALKAIGNQLYSSLFPNIWVNIEIEVIDKVKHSFVQKRATHITTNGFQDVIINANNGCYSVLIHNMGPFDS